MGSKSKNKARSKAKKQVKRPTGNSNAEKSPAVENVTGDDAVGNADEPMSGAEQEDVETPLQPDAVAEETPADASPITESQPITNDSEQVANSAAEGTSEADEAELLTETSDTQPADTALPEEQEPPAMETEISGSAQENLNVDLEEPKPDTEVEAEVDADVDVVAEDEADSGAVIVESDTETKETETVADNSESVATDHAEEKTATEEVHDVQPEASPEDPTPATEPEAEDQPFWEETPAETAEESQTTGPADTAELTSEQVGVSVAPAVQEAEDKLELDSETKLGRNEEPPVLEAPRSAAELIAETIEELSPSKRGETNQEDLPEDSFYQQLVSNPEEPSMIYNSNIANDSDLIEENEQEEEDDDFYKSLKEPVELELDDDFLDDGDELEAEVESRPPASQLQLSFLESDDDLLSDDDEFNGEGELNMEAMKSPSATEFRTDQNGFDLPMEFVKQQPRRHASRAVSREDTPSLGVHGRMFSGNNGYDPAFSPNVAQLPGSRFHSRQSSRAYTDSLGHGRTFSQSSNRSMASFEMRQFSGHSPLVDSGSPIFQRPSNPDPFGFPELPKVTKPQLTRAAPSLTDVHEKARNVSLPTPVQTVNQPPLPAPSKGAPRVPRAASSASSKYAPAAPSPYAPLPVPNMAQQPPMPGQLHSPMPAPPAAQMPPPAVPQIPQPMHAQVPLQPAGANPHELPTPANTAPIHGYPHATQHLVPDPKVQLVPSPGASHPEQIHNAITPEAHLAGQQPHQGSFVPPKPNTPQPTSHSVPNLQPRGSEPLANISPMNHQGGMNYTTENFSVDQYSENPAQFSQELPSPEILSKLPFPLLGPKGPIKNKGKDLEKWLDELLTAEPQGKLLYRILRALLAGKDQVKEILSEKFVEIKEQEYTPPAPLDISVVFEELINNGPRAAVQKALDSKQYGHALLIANSLDAEQWQLASDEFVAESVRPTNGPMAFVYRVLSARSKESAVAAINELKPRGQTELVDYPKLDENLKQWARCVCGIYDTNEHSSDALRELGTLLFSRDMVEEAQVCYMLGKTELGVLDGFVMPLVDKPGSEALKFDSFVLAEVYEYVSGRGSVHALPFKLQFASLLADAGNFELALKMSENMVSVLKYTKNAPPHLLEAASELTSRCSSKVSSSSTTSWLQRKLSRPQIEKTFVSSFNKFVSGEVDNEPVARPSSTTVIGSHEPLDPNFQMPVSSTPQPYLESSLYTPSSRFGAVVEERSSMVSPGHPAPTQSQIPFGQPPSQFATNHTQLGGAISPYPGAQGANSQYQGVPEPSPYAPPADGNPFAPQMHGQPGPYNSDSYNAPGFDQSTNMGMNPFQSQPNYQPGPPAGYQANPSYSGFSSYEPQNPMIPGPANQPQLIPQPQMVPQPQMMPPQMQQPQQMQPQMPPQMIPQMGAPGDASHMQPQPGAQGEDNGQGNQHDDGKGKRKGWFSWLKKEDGDKNKPFEVKLGSNEEMFFDKDLGRWRKKGEPAPPPAPSIKPPPKAASTNTSTLQPSVPMDPQAPAGVPIQAAVPNPGVPSMPAAPGAVPAPGQLTSQVAAPAPGPVPGQAPAPGPGPGIPTPGAAQPSKPSKPSVPGDIDSLLAVSASAPGTSRRRGARGRYVGVTETGLPQGL